jgi:hypothetical protein
VPFLFTIFKPFNSLKKIVEKKVIAVLQKTNIKIPLQPQNFGGKTK